MTGASRREKEAAAHRQTSTTRSPSSRRDHEATLPRSRHDIMHGHRQPPKGKLRNKVKVRPSGESGRSGIHPMHFFRIIWRSASWLSRAVNVLWPVVPAAIVVLYVVPAHHVLKFSLAYIAMVPCANLVGFAGQELARKMPHMLGVLTETTISSIVEITLFLILLLAPNIPERFVLIKGAILGSILATMLLCLGLCFIAAGFRRDDTHFAEAISEAGSGLLLTAGVGLAVPAIFESAVTGRADLELAGLEDKVLAISRGVAIVLLVAYLVFVYFQTQTHHGLFEAIFESDEARDDDRHKDAAKAKLTLTECIVALLVAVALVAVIAYQLVLQIPYIIEEHDVTDPFMGLILVPLVEKAAEHLTAIDEAYDNQMNFALSHCLGATLQTALLNAPLVVLVGWGQGIPMGLDFEIFDIAMLILAIITVGNFLRDQKSNYLEGFLSVTVYVAIAIAAFNYPRTKHHGAATAATAGGEGGGGH